MKPGRTWLVYTLIRLGLFAGVLILLLLLQITPWLAAVIAALIALCISIIFLRKPREEASKTLYEARNNRGQAASRPSASREDESVEDDAVDHAAGDEQRP
ncbi:DUF4229 domain-containing protein [Herbiconiux sp. UC225_62]|uniref:DUF4229 domain-containing protein n=1 Tax=Herbiconiux sp. UC225_62 TaxID=3350168 RepID=UPI0036D2BB19